MSFSDKNLSRSLRFSLILASLFIILAAVTAIAISTSGLPVFVNNGPPAINATNLNNIVDSVEAHGLNIIDYGADPTGTTDSSPAFNAAIAALPAEGGSIFVPHGTYIVDSTITLNKWFHIYGEGSGDTGSRIIVHNAGMGTLFNIVISEYNRGTVGSPQYTYALPCIENLMLDGNDYTVKAIVQGKDTAYDLTVKNIWFDSFASDVITINGNHDHRFESCTFEHNNGRCIVFAPTAGSTSANSAFITNCYFAYNKYGIDIGEMTGGCIISNNNFCSQGKFASLYGDGYDIRIDNNGASDGNTNGIQITSNYFNTPWYDSIRFNPTSCAIIGVIINGNSWSNCQANANCIRFQTSGAQAGTYIKNLNIVDNTAWKAYNFVYVDDNFPCRIGEGFTISNNNIWGQTPSSIGAALRINTGTQTANRMVHITDNFFYYFGTGIDLKDCYEATVTGNQFEAVTTPYSRLLNGSITGAYPHIVKDNIPDPGFDYYNGTTDASGQYTITAFKCHDQTYKPGLQVNLGPGGQQWNIASWTMDGANFRGVVIQVYDGAGAAVSAGVEISVKVVPN
jgi:hypothetical protein